MTLHTPDEVPDCVKSSVFTEVELAHDWTLQPPLAAYLDIHRSISVCSWCGASLNEEYAGNALLRAFLTCPDRTHVYWRSEGEGALETCSSTLYSRICRKCGYPTENDVYCTKCANSVSSRALDPGIGRKKFDRPRPRYR